MLSLSLSLSLALALALALNQTKDTWLLFNDIKVSVVQSAPEVQKGQAYLLFYEQRVET